MAGVSFTPGAARRIATTVRRVEGIPSDNVGNKVGSLARSTRNFWAKLTGNDVLTDGRHKYSWQAVLLDQDGFKDYTDTTNIREGDLEAGDDGIDRYAIDVNEWKSDAAGDALANDRVVLMFLDYYTDDDDKVLPRYTFSSGGGGGIAGGQYMGMGFMKTSQNQSGWSFPFFGAYVG